MDRKMKKMGSRIAPASQRPPAAPAWNATSWAGSNNLTHAGFIASESRHRYL